MSILGVTMHKLTRCTLVGWSSKQRLAEQLVSNGPRCLHSALKVESKVSLLIERFYMRRYVPDHAVGGGQLESDGTYPIDILSFRNIRGKGWTYSLAVRRFG